MDYQAKFTEVKQERWVIATLRMSILWSVARVAPKVFKSSYKIAFYPNRIFFRRCSLHEIRIRWENKNFDVTLWALYGWKKGTPSKQYLRSWYVGLVFGGSFLNFRRALPSLSSSTSESPWGTIVSPGASSNLSTPTENKVRDETREIHDCVIDLNTTMQKIANENAVGLHRICNWSDHDCVGG